MRRPRIAALAAVTLLAVLLTGCAAPAVRAPAAPPPRTAALSAADVDTWLDGLVPAALERTGIPGAAVAVVRDGRVLTARGFGSAGAGEPVDPDRTLFRVGSVSKVATATAVLQLAEQGRIDLDADIGRYVDFPLPRRFDQPITMRNLLTHTAGFEERIRGLITPNDGSEDLRTTVATDPPEQVFAPGTVPAYSNYGYGLAGYIVERVTGTPFDEHLRRAVLAPAGAASATFTQPLPAPLRERMSAAYLPTGEEAPFETVRPSAAGALTASATDMARLSIALLTDGGPLLTPTGRAWMQQPALGPDTLGSLAAGPRMTLGLFDESRNGHRILGHGGDTGYFHSHLQLYPQDRTAVFVTLNGSGRAAADSLHLRRAVLDGFNDRYFPPSGPQAPAGPTPSSGDAAAVAGTYTPARSAWSTFMAMLGTASQIRFTAGPDGTLIADPDPTDVGPGTYREVRPGVWQQVDGQRVLTVRGAGDRVDAIGFESAFTLLRVPAWRDAAIVVPVLVGSLVVLAGCLLAVPAGAMARRRYGVVAAVPPGRTAHRLARVAAVVALLAAAGWAAAVTMIAGLTEVPALALHGVQALQWVALAGVLPAALAVRAAVRGRAGWPAVTGRVLLLLGLVGVAGFALMSGLLVPDVSY